jgi:hypothetical protein
MSYIIEHMDTLNLAEAVEGRGESISNHSLRFNLLTHKRGKLCGAISIDENFQKLIQARIGSKWEKLSRSSIVRLNNEWEYGIKRLFNNDTSRTWKVTMPAEVVSRFSVSFLHDKKKRGIPIMGGSIQLTS